MNRSIVIEVAERLYYEKNPNTKMDVPSSVYELVERWYKQWVTSQTYLDFYDWCKKEKK